ncbi:MAG: peptidoglycan editing factor PgeF [Devosiaceae bacterium]|nr:peptidoglycan editing factor PgeF [Devosiaceae bacterium]
MNEPDTSKKQQIEHEQSSLHLEKMSLGERIRLQIKSEGPISLSTYMGLCLTHPQKGYYTSSNPIGTKGDFITAPEISQMFGEMLGTWVLLQWNFLGRPKTFTLAELGPGRGTLMADILRVVAKDPVAIKGAKIALLETSQPLKNLQGQALKKYDPIWINEIEELGNSSQPLTSQPLIIIANEFFDALPIKQYQFQNLNWHERLIGLQGGELVWGLSPSPLSEDFANSEIHQHLKTPAKENEIFQTSPLSIATISRLSRLLNEHSGSMLIIDYGYEVSQTGDSFQAVADHEFCDPLEKPGHADLSAHVDFQSLIKTARQVGTQAGMLGNQGHFLQQLGIKQRAEKIIQANPQKDAQITLDLARLIDSDKMGTLFKAMQISSPTKAAPAKAAPAKAPFERLEDLSGLPGIRHGFFGREGGCSPAPFDSLNVSKLTKDAPENISRNRQTVANSLGLPLNRLAILHQIHSDKVVTVDKNFDFENPIKADAMVSNISGIGLGVLIADCTPVLFYDPKNSIIGAAHAGWQGAIKGIIANTIEAMENLGADREKIIAGIGPTIWQENYEVGEQFARDLLEQHPQAKKFIAIPKNRTKQHFDLPGFVRSEIKKAGITRISQTPECTYANPQKYFSHRFATHNYTDTGRQIAIIAIK